MSDDELVELATWAEQRLPQLVDQAYEATLDRVPFYRTANVVPSDDLRRSIGQNMQFLISVIAAPQVTPDLTVTEATGRRRAVQGAPLPEVLRCYRICFVTLWDCLVEYTRDLRRPAAAEALLATATMMLQLTDQHALALTEGYRAATAELLQAQQQRRSALVEALLTGHPGPDAGPWEAATLLGLPPDRALAVVVADTRGLAEPSLPGIEQRLAEHGMVSGWRLTPAQQLGIVSLPEGPEGLDYALELLRAVATSRTGVSPLYRSLADTPRALHLAEAALAGIPVARVEVRMFSPSPLAALMACEPGEGRRLADDVLGPVLGLPADDRATLLDTLNAYLDHGGSAEQAAQVLYCHPNTVRYRLRRVQELTDRSLADPRDVAELAAAAAMIRLSPPTAPAIAPRPRRRPLPRR